MFGLRARRSAHAMREDIAIVAVAARMSRRVRIEGLDTISSAQFYSTLVTTLIICIGNVQNVDVEPARGVGTCRRVYRDEELGAECRASAAFTDYGPRTS